MRDVIIYLRASRVLYYCCVCTYAQATDYITSLQSATRVPLAAFTLTPLAAKVGNLDLAPIFR